MLIQPGAIKLCQTKIVRREMARHPVQNDVQPRLMRGIHKIAEIITRPETTGRRIHAGRLVAPTAVERMLVNRQQLEMGKAHPLGVRNQLIRQFAVAQPEVVISMTTP